MKVEYCISFQGIYLILGGLVTIIGSDGKPTQVSASSLPIPGSLNTLSGLSSAAGLGTFTFNCLSFTKYPTIQMLRELSNSDIICPVRENKWNLLVNENSAPLRW